MKKLEIILGLIVAIILSVICVNLFNNKDTKKVVNTETIGQVINDVKNTIVVDLSSEVQPQIEEAKNLTATIDGQEIKNKYYYNQLDEYGKIIYSGLYKNKDQLKTGT